ncbi:hypothetical protein PUN28_011752 [Cardiocondyla obscurior]|uniref:Uncharacterized protein n=1 Tax=Cardiocondyla obscurior TaxID=286306 RepID=A0AAW2FFE8_9HYME
MTSFFCGFRQWHFVAKCTQVAIKSRFNYRRHERKVEKGTVKATGSVEDVSETSFSASRDLYSREEKKDHESNSGGKNWRPPGPADAEVEVELKTPQFFTPGRTRLVDRPLHFQCTRHASMKCTIIGMFLASVLFVRVMREFNPMFLPLLSIIINNEVSILRDYI